MLMVPQPLELNFKAYEHAALYAQQLSEDAEALKFEILPPPDDESNRLQTELQETRNQAAKTFSELVELLRELYVTNTEYIKAAEELLAEATFVNAWTLAESFAEKPKQSPGLNEEVITWSVANFDPKGDSEAVIRKAYASRVQVLELYAKVKKVIKLSLDARDRRKKVIVPQTEEEMVKRAERFAKQNRKVISELSRI